MDTTDLKQIFALTAAASLGTFAVAFPFNASWALDYGVLGTLALANWIALAMVLQGYTRRNFVQLAGGVAVKPLLLVFLLIIAKHRGLEITSFLAAMNTFFLCVFLFLIKRSFEGRLRPAVKKIS